MPNRRRMVGAPWAKTANTHSLIVGTAIGASTMRLGYTFTHQEQNADLTEEVKGFIGDAARVLNQHIVGFGASDPYTSSTAVETDPIDWDDLDQRLGYDGTPTGPTDFGGQAEGWYSTIPEGEGCITFCGCPRWMRRDPANTYAVGSSLNDPNDWRLGTPTNSELTTASAYQPPWVGHWDAFARFCVKVIKRYPHLKYGQVWNEFKNFHSNSLNRWWYEGYTRMYNKIWDLIQVEKAAGRIRADFQLIGPYIVVSSFTWDSVARQATTANSGGDPTRVLEGAWGAFDRRVLDVVRYFATNAHGCDQLGLDIRNISKDGRRYNYGVTVTDAVFNGTTTITSASGMFAPSNAGLGDDDGYLITGAGIPAGASVATYVSPTEITISAATTVSGTGRTITWGQEIAKGWPFTDARKSYHWLTDAWSASIRQQAIVAWLNLLAATYPELYGATNPNGINLATIPICWDEWYANPPNEIDLIGGDPTPEATMPQMLSVEAWNLIESMRLGRTGLLLKWRLEGGEHGISDRADCIALWDRTTHEATILLELLTFIQDHFPVGTQLHNVISSHPNLRAVASTTHILAVSRSPSAMSVVIDGTLTALDAYGVAYVVRGDDGGGGPGGTLTTSTTRTTSTSLLTRG